MVPRLIEVFLLREENERINFLHPGTEIQILDRSRSAPEEGAWIDSRIRERFIDMVNGKKMVGYSVSAPWTVAGETDVYIENYGKSWRLKESV